MANDYSGPIAHRLAQIQGSKQNNVSSNESRPPSKQQKKKQRWTEREFAGKPVWEWLSVLLVPLMIGLGTIGVTWQQSILSERQHESDQQIAKESRKQDLQIAAGNRQQDLQIAADQQREAVLKTYMDDISNLLLHEGLRTSQPEDEVRIIATTKTHAALDQLDGERRGRLISFISALHLIDKKDTLIALSKANLVGAYMIKVNLFGANLQEVSLNEANLAEANLEEANLSGADLSLVNLQQANLSRADLEGAELFGAGLRNAKVTPEQLSKAFSFNRTTLPNGSKFPSKTWPIPGRDEKCAWLWYGRCYSQYPR